MAMSSGPLHAANFGSPAIANNTPAYVSSAQKLGPEDPRKVIEVSIWLQPHNRAQLDALAESLYDKSSPNYRHWLKASGLRTKFAPTAQEAKMVREYLQAHNLTVLKTGANNFYVRARGTVADVEGAFHTQLNTYRVGNETVRANAADPSIDGPAAGLVRAVSGLDSGSFQHPVSARASFGGSGTPARSAASAAMNADVFSSQCFPGTEKESFSTNGTGQLPVATYSGNRINLQTQTSAGCAYTPPVIQTAYNLTALYNEGYNGAGQTIAILDWCGSSTIQSDANAFSATFGLPALTSSNFNIIYTAPSSCIAADQVEINLDVEWAHAIAPGANINLVVPPSASFQDVDQAEFDILNNGWGNVMSGSYTSTELYTATAELETENLINEIGATMGVSTNFASGDNGNYSLQTLRQTVSAPADSPWATAVGGVTLAVNPDNSIAWQAGWGNNLTLLAEEGTVYDPPKHGFSGGSGGGPSQCVTKNFRFRPPLCTGGFAKPTYQKALPGTTRQLPDVSWLADPYTGVPILITVPNQYPAQVWQVFGGTSLATPMFSALWAIANQEAVAGGGSELGQAAPYLYSMPAGTVYDIVPVGSKTNVSGVIQDASGTTKYTALQLAGVSGGEFVSAIWDYPWLPSTALVVTFGTDTSLKPKKGWDNVTGVGTPNAKAFADFFYGQ
jgi:subtilase family serine protease